MGLMRLVMSVSRFNWMFPARMLLQFSHNSSLSLWLSLHTQTNVTTQARGLLYSTQGSPLNAIPAHCCPCPCPKPAPLPYPFCRIGNPCSSTPAWCGGSPPTCGIIGYGGNPPYPCPAPDGEPVYAAW